MTPIQQSNATYLFRNYAALHQALAVRTMLGHRAPRRVLSYGCSVGDELISLIAMMPQIQLFGCDVSEAALSQAEAASSAFGARVFRSAPRHVRRHGPYDVILANSVFCRHPESTRVDSLHDLFPFSSFEDGIGELLDVLAPGGIFQIVDSNYPISLLGEASSLVPITTCEGRPFESGVAPFSGMVDRFRKDGAKFGKRITTTSEDGFEIVSPPGFNLQEAFFDHIYVKRGTETSSHRYSVRRELLDTTEELQNLGTSEIEMWSTSRTGTPFLGTKKKRSIRHIDRRRRLVIEERSIIDLTNGAVVSNTLSGTVIMTTVSTQPGLDKGAPGHFKISYWQEQTSGTAVELI